jgi:Transposase
VSFNANGGTLVSVHSTDPALARVQVGIDAAVVADHHVTIRSTLSDAQVQLSRFHVPPTIAGLSRLGERLCSFPGVVAVAEPTSMTWLGLHVALQRAGCDLSLVGTRHAARLRGAISGKHKSDVIDADVLSLASDVFELSLLDLPVRRSWRCAARSCAAGNWSSTATGRGDKYVTVIIDLTGIRSGTGPSRLLDMVEDRSMQAFEQWLAEREDSWRDGVEVVAMDGFTGFKTATTEELPDAVTVMDPFYAEVLVMPMRCWLVLVGAVEGLVGSA